MTDIRTVTVVGAGTMGAGIAQACAMAGCRVRLVDVNPDVLARGMARIREALDKGVEKGKVEPATRDAALAAIETADAPAPGADLAIEAVPEDMALKERVFRALEARILATNTSSLSVAAIASASPHPERVVGLHFFNPVHIMKLLEVVVPDGADPAIVDEAIAFGRRIGKTPIRVKDSPGFASSRLGVALGLEAIRMVEEGVASPQDIDTAMTLGYGHPMGPLALTDLVGLDVRLGIARYLQKTLHDERFRPPDLMARMVESGKLGRKSGEGFYRYDGSPSARSSSGRTSS